MTVWMNGHRLRTLLARLLVVSAGLLAISAEPSVAAPVVDRNSFGGVCDDTRAVAQVSITAPWCTLERAVAATPSGGDVTVRRGDYPRLTVTNNRARIADVTFTRLPGETVVIAGVTLLNSSYLAFEDLTLTGGADLSFDSDHVRLRRNTIAQGVNVRAGANSIVIEDNQIRNDYGSAINFSSTPAARPISDVTIRANRITRAVVDGVQLKNFRNVLIEGNEITGVARTDPEEHADVIQTVFGGAGLVVRANHIHDNAGGILVKDGTTSGVVFENNLIVNNVGDGTSYAIQLFESIAPRIVNNTIWDNRYGVFLRSGTTAAVVVNNILQTFGVLEGATAATENYNLIGGGGGAGAADLEGGPTFVSSQTGDFRLMPGSRGVDAGTSEGAPALDGLGNQRFDDPAVVNSGGGAMPYVDMGAYERGGSPAPDPGPGHP